MIMLLWENILMICRLSGLNSKVTSLYHGDGFRILRTLISRNNQQIE